MKKKFNNSYLLPSNFDVEVFNEKLKEKFGNKSANILNRVLCILNIIITKPSMSENKNDEDGYVTLKAEYLRKYIPNAEKYLRLLIDNNVIETDNQYIIGEKSKRYRLKHPYNGSPTKYKEEKEDETQEDDKERVIKFQSFDKNAKKLKYLYKHFNGKLKIDLKGALKQSYKEYWGWDTEKLPIYFEDIDISSSRSIGINRRGNSYLSKEHEEAYDMLMNEMVIPTLTLNFKQIFFKVDKSGYRLHTNLTNLKKSLRSYATFGGERLVGYDIKNSQPFLMLNLLKESFWHKESNEINYKQLEGELGTMEGLRKVGIIPTITLLKIEEMQYSRGFQLFKKLVENGELYEYLVTEVKNEMNKEVSREIIKKDFLAFMFDKPKEQRKYSYLSDKIVPAKFAGLTEILNYFKEKKYPTLALLLQNIESTIVLRRICPLLSRKYPEIPLFTIHDSIATTLTNKSFISPVMTSVIISLTGFKPIIKEENW
jgi:hypothetical protein